MIKIRIPRVAAAVIAALEGNGYEAYVVGGCVRDAILSREPNDWDVTTSCPAEETLEIFTALDGFEAIPTGLKHGTVTVVREGVPIEVTTFRVDMDYVDHRHPTSVRFSERIEEDLSRRDFTVNAIAYSERNGIVDPFGGVSDIEAKIIRCVGDAKTRFTEDALRIMRALRFSAQIGFDIHPDTADAASELASTLSYISKERVSAELSKLLLGGDAPRILRAHADIISHAAPMLCVGDIQTAAERIGTMPDACLATKLAAFLCGVELERVNSFFESLRFDGKTEKTVGGILAHLDVPTSDKPSVKRLCRDVGIDAARKIFAVRHSLGQDVERENALLDEITESEECYSVAQLCINGHDLMALGCGGSRVGDLLRELTDLVIDGKIQNDKKSLMGAASALIDGVKL